MADDWNVTAEAPTEMQAGTPATLVVRPPKLTPADLTTKAMALGYAPGGAAGVVQNILRESAGDPANVGDGGTSYGLFQHHAERKAALESYAKTNGLDPADADAQFRFHDEEMRTQYPKLRAILMDPKTTPQQAEEAFRTVYERPKVDPATATTGNEKYRFSDFALKQYANKPDTDLVWMRPQDYLDLTPDLGDDPRKGKSYKDLRKSLDRGDAIEEVPTLEVTRGGDGAKVTDQDGRHRALAAQESGLDLIPVAVKRVGTKGSLTELEGMNGRLMPYDFQPYSAEGGAWQVTGEEAPDGALMSGVKGVGAGIANTALGAAELAGNVLQGSSGSGLPPSYIDSLTAPAGKFLADKAQEGVAAVKNWMAPDTEAHPVAAGAGELLGMTLGPGGVGMRMAGNALKAGAVSGGLSSLFSPSDPSSSRSYFGQKAIGVPLGTAAGLAVGAVGGAVSKAAAPVFRKAVDTLMREGVELTPGQLAGGIAKATEDKATSIPITGDAIIAARKRAVAGFNVAAYNRALAPIGEKYEGPPPGPDAIGALRERLSAAYDRVLTGVTFRADAQLRDDARNLMGMVSEMPADQARRFKAILENRVVKRLAPTGTMDGQTFKQVESELSFLSSGMHSSADMADRHLGDALDEVNASLRAGLERTNPGKQAELKAANRAWAMFARVRKAAGNRVKSLGVFTPGDLLSAAKMGDRTAGKGVFAEGDALMQDLAAAGEEVIGSNYPDSGTAGRLLLRGITGGGIGVEGMHSPMAMLGILGASAAAAAPYTATATRWTNMLMSRLANNPGPTQNALATIARGMVPAAAPSAAHFAPGQR